jgi:hypothetical protein
MKKLFALLLALVMIFSVSTAFASSHNDGKLKKGNFVLKAGMDSGNIESSVLGVNVDESTEMGFSLVGEYIIPTENNISYGVGVEFPLGGRKPDVSNAVDFTFIPFYGLVKLQTNEKFFLTGKLGYNTFSVDNLPSDADANGGMYYGIGGGVKLKDNVELEVLYSVSNGGLEATSGGLTATADVEFSRIGAFISTSF